MRTFALVLALPVALSLGSCSVPTDPDAARSDPPRTDAPAPTKCRHGAYSLKAVGGKALPGLGWRLQPGGQEVLLTGADLAMNSVGVFIEYIRLATPDGQALVGQSFNGRYVETGCQLRGHGLNALYESTLQFTTESKPGSPSFSFSGSVSGLTFTASVQGYTREYQYVGYIDW